MTVSVVTLLAKLTDICTALVDLGEKIQIRDLRRYVHKAATFIKTYAKFTDPDMMMLKSVHNERFTEMEALLTHQKETNGSMYGTVLNNCQS